MAQFANMYDIDLLARNDPQPLRATIGGGDSNGLRVGANVTSGRSPVTLGGQCVGKVKRADGATVPLTGTVSGSSAWVTLDGESCKVGGPVQVAVLWVSGTNITTLVIAYGTVIRTETGYIVEPSTPLPDLTQLLAEIEAMREATAAANAAATKSVRYDEAQSLDSTKKTTARSNIDAAGISQVVRHDAAQSLSDGQKLQAQHNIGMNAGNMASEFSSSHNYEVGEFFTHGSYLYYVKENRSAGAWSDSDVDDTNGPFVHAAATSYIMRTAGITAKQFDPTEDYLKGEYFVYDYHLYQLTANFTHTGSFPTTGVRRAYLAEDVPQISVSGTTLVIS